MKVIFPDTNVKKFTALKSIDWINTLFDYMDISNGYAFLTIL